MFRAFFILDSTTFRISPPKLKNLTYVVNYTQEVGYGTLPTLVH
jgi:hypothetical protein